MFDHFIFNKTPFDKRNFEDGNLYISMHGNGTIEYAGIFETPISAINIGGNGSLLIPLISIKTPFIIQIRNNNGTIQMPMVMLTPLNIQFYSFGEFEIFRIGENIISLLDLNAIELEPGESVAIDTDLMTILFQGVHDVSSLTPISKFFNLGSGLNDIQFVASFDVLPNPRTNEELDITIIWENRWL